MKQAIDRSRALQVERRQKERETENKEAKNSLSSGKCETMNFSKLNSRRLSKKSSVSLSWSTSFQSSQTSRRQRPSNNSRVTMLQVCKLRRCLTSKRKISIHTQNVALKNGRNRERMSSPSLWNLKTTESASCEFDFSIIS